MLKSYFLKKKFDYSKFARLVLWEVWVRIWWVFV